MDKWGLYDESYKIAADSDLLVRYLYEADLKVYYPVSYTHLLLGNSNIDYLIIYISTPIIVLPVCILIAKTLDNKTNSVSYTHLCQEQVCQGFQSGW